MESHVPPKSWSQAERQSMISARRNQRYLFAIKGTSLGNNVFQLILWPAGKEILAVGEVPFPIYHRCFCAMHGWLMIVSQEWWVMYKNQIVNSGTSNEGCSRFNISTSMDYIVDPSRNGFWESSMSPHLKMSQWNWVVSEGGRVREACPTLSRDLEGMFIQFEVVMHFHRTCCQSHI